MVGIGTAAGATATYLAGQPIPLEIKTPICVVLGAVSVAILAFWSAKVTAKA